MKSAPICDLITKNHSLCDFFAGEFTGWMAWSHAPLDSNLFLPGQTLMSVMGLAAEYEQHYQTRARFGDQ